MVVFLMLCLYNLAMANSENFKPVGTFSIDAQDCMGKRMCVALARGVNLKVEKIDDKKYLTHVVAQPTTREEEVLMIEGLGICPFGAGKINGDSTHPAFREQARAVIDDPSFVDRAYTVIKESKKPDSTKKEGDF